MSVYGHPFVYKKALENIDYWLIDWLIHCVSIGKHFHVSCQRERLDGSTHVPQLTQQTVFSFTNWLSVFVHNDIVTSYRRVQI